MNQNNQQDLCYRCGNADVFIDIYDDCYYCNRCDLPTHLQKIKKT